MDAKKKIFIEARGITIAKEDASPKECEDAMLLGKRIFCVADGAGGASYSREWARSLCWRSSQQPPPILDGEQREAQALTDWLAPARKYWHDLVPWSLIDRPISMKKTKNGAGSTFAALEFTETIQTKPYIGWPFRCWAIGDSCIFQLRESKCLWSRPIASGDDFDFIPPMLHSCKETEMNITKNWHQWNDIAYPGDIILLATDAFAEFIHTAFLQPGSYAELYRWIDLLSLSKSLVKVNYDLMIKNERRCKRMANDDIAFIAIKIKVQ